MISTESVLAAYRIAAALRPHARIALAWVLCSLAAPLSGQQEPPLTGAIAGQVVDAEAGTPLPGAVVQIEPRWESAGEDISAAAPRRSHLAISDSVGGYSFPGLAPALYRVRVRRVGYRPLSVDVEVRVGTERRLSLGLAVEPVVLDPMEVRIEIPDAFMRARPAPSPAPRIAGATLGPRASLAMDARELTYAGVLHSITLGEPDLFRALQRLPGVGTRSDYTAELWTRGAPWHETRVYFDGVPLFNPLHGLGAFSGISPRPVGAVVFHPGVRPASVGEGGAGVVDFHSRGGSGGGELNLRGDLSLVSMGLSADQSLGGGRFAWMLSGRRTYLDWLTRLASAVVDRPDLHVPYAFSDVIVRLDAAPSATEAIQLSGIRERDRLSGEAGPAAEWGNSAARLSLESRRRGITLRHSVGASRYIGAVNDTAAVQVPPLLPLYGFTSRSAIGHSSLRGEVYSSASPQGLPRWSIGYEASRQTVEYQGLADLGLPRWERSLADAGQASRSPVAADPADALSNASELRMVALWGERGISRGRLSLQAGLRVEAGDEVRDAGAVRAAPRLSARYSPGSPFTLSMSLGRSFQYTQAIAPAGIRLASLSSSYLWLLADRRVPPLRTDLLTLGVGIPRGDAWSAAVSLYHRRSTGVVTADPHPGPLFEREAWVAGEAEASGVEISAEGRAGSWRGTGAYTYGVSATEAGGVRFPASADRRHVVNVTAHCDLTPSWRWGAAFSAASGVPFTRVYGADVECPDPATCRPGPIPWTGPPNAARSRPYASLDLSLDWSTVRPSGEWGAFLQIRNVLGRENGTMYTGRAAGCSEERCLPRGFPEERFERGLPRLLVLGLRVGR